MEANPDNEEGSESEVQPSKVFVGDTNGVVSPIVGETEYDKVTEVIDKAEEEIEQEPDSVGENNVASGIEEPADARVVSELEAFVHNTVHDSPSTLSKDPATYLQTVDLTATTTVSNVEPSNDGSTPEGDHDEIDRLPNPASIGEIDNDSNVLITSIDEVITDSLPSVEDTIGGSSDHGIEGADLLSAISDFAASASVNSERSDDVTGIPSIQDPSMHDPTISKFLGLSREDETELDDEMMTGAGQNLLGLASYNSPEMDDSFTQIGSIIGEPDKGLEDDKSS